MDQPLSNVRVLDLGQIYLGGYAGLMLAHMGADVVKVEPPWGDNVRSRTEDFHSPQFQFLNPNKRSITLDLKSDNGQEVLKDLVEEADVLLENFARGTMERLGIGYETLREVNDKLIYGHGSGYGDYGPYADYPAMDMTIQAMGGVMHTTGYPDQPPVKAGPAVCDFSGGSHLAMGILGALYMREYTETGQYIDVAMLDCTFPTLASPVASLVLERDAPPRTGNQHSALDIAPYNNYEVADGYIILICISERHWDNLCDVIGRPELKDDDRFETKVKREQTPEVVENTLFALLGSAHTLEILREVALGSQLPVRFCELEETLTLSPNTLARRSTNSLESGFLSVRNTMRVLFESNPVRQKS
jgi:crotonobetainyl-CoA:carnitine CoA-transferase CaiB-like acyl-CoA transferase